MQDLGRALVFVGIQNISTCTQCPGVNPHKCQRSNKWVSHNLECKTREGLSVTWLSVNSNFRVLKITTLHRREVQWRWQEIDDSIQQGLHSLVLKSWPTKHRNKGEGNGSCPDKLPDSCFIRLNPFQVLLHGFIILFHDCLDHIGSVFCCEIHQILRNVRILELGTKLFTIPHYRLHSHEVYNPCEGVFSSDRNLQNQRGRTQITDNHVSSPEEIRT